MANGDGQGKEFLPGDLVEDADQKYEKGTTVKQIVDWLKGKGKEPKPKSSAPAGSPVPPGSPGRR